MASVDALNLEFYLIGDLNTNLLPVFKIMKLDLF